MVDAAWTSESADRQRNRGSAQMNAAHKKTKGLRSANRISILGGKEPNSVPSHIVPSLISRVNSRRQSGSPRKVHRKSRRQQHGSAWHRKQTDCWYYTPPGTKKREALFDDDGERIRGKDTVTSSMPCSQHGKSVLQSWQSQPLVT
jgi:hypothetical protein